MKTAQQPPNKKSARWHRGVLFSTALALSLGLSTKANAWELLGVGTEFLIGGDLTDPENDGNPEAPDVDPGTLNEGYEAIFDSSEEPGFGGGEFAFNLFDNVVGGGNDKWCCGAAFPLWVTATFPEPIVLESFTVAAANDTPDRDPRVWEIQGSNDGENFETIFRQDDPDAALWGERLEVIHFKAGEDFPAVSKDYTTFRFFVEATGLTTGAFFQVAEVEYFGRTGGLTDTDGDGMPDRYETDNGLDPAVNDAAADLDGDTVSNFEEFKTGTNPQNGDTDGDGLSDAAETGSKTWLSITNTGSSPTRPDSDGDGLPDGLENPDFPYIAGTQPGSDPNLKDTDGDGAYDGLEYNSGFDPTDPESVPSIQLKGGNFTVRHLDTSSTIDSRDAAIMLIDGETDADKGEITVQRPFVNFVDDSAASFSDSDEVFPLYGPEGNGEGSPTFGGGPNHEDFAIEATGKFFIQAPGGDVAMGVNSDDGFVLWIDGEEIGEAGNRGRGDSIFTVNLTPGQHDLRLVYWERGGGAGVNLYISRGFTTETLFVEANYELLNAFDISLAPLEGDDSDADQMADTWENFYFGNLSNNGTTDTDADGLTDLGEYQHFGNPTVKDTDGDGLEDGAEVNTYQSAPNRIDSDGDSLADGAEVNVHKTSPSKADTDGDTYSDNVELALGTDPLISTSKPDAIIAVNRGTWADASTWSDGSAPSAAKHYVVVNTVSPNLATPRNGAKDFAGGSLTLIGEGTNLSLQHSGIAKVEGLVSQGAIITADRTRTGVVGHLEVKASTVMHVGLNVLDIRSQLSGSGEILAQGETEDTQSGTLSLHGVNSAYTGDFNIVGTTLSVDMPGAAGTGSITLQAGGLTANHTIFAPASTLNINGDGFTITLNADVVVNDLSGIDEDGNILFNISELAPGVTEFDAAMLNEAFQTDVVSGEGKLVIGGGDSDNDGLYDAWEIANFANLSHDGTADGDADGLNDLLEFHNGSDPANADTDGDGLADGAEVLTHGSSPIFVDTDGDTVDDPTEVADNGDPNNPDNTGGVAPIGPTIEVLGIGTGALLGSDLTDPQNDGNELLGPDDASWNWVSITSNNEPFFDGGEGSFNIFDNRLGGGDDKWCCDDPTPDAPLNVTVEFAAPVELTKFTISSANDTPARDPIWFEIQGSNDGENFTAIYTRNDPEPLWNERLQVILITLPQPAPAYKFLRYEVFDTPDPLHQLGEIEYFGTIGGDGGNGGNGGNGGGNGAPVIETVVAGPSSFGLSFTGALGKTYTIEYSEDLITWTPVVTGQAGAVSFEDTDATRQERGEGYYRAIEE